ncbi:sensor histidine kinase [Glutamicibacter creatinolyticus]|uniref:histidine kinase n=1 Tax=Glutamicibacter creatinolyticus TaxID=162496 RepID=A0A5B7WSI4_9MICC|nr:HAMP domain-containing sensor histidine kinase [Glutamicibacter creatinolyticus]QCY46225.1 Two-component sensor histidine kinase [Glutamicibacter creatinolyticus]
MQALRLSWRRTSLRTKLVMLMCGLMILGVIATAVGSAQSLRISLTKQIDDQLLAAGPTLSYGLNQAYRYALDGDRNPQQQTGVDTTLLGLNRAYADIRDDSGKIVYIMPRSRVTPTGMDSPLLAPEQTAKLAETPWHPVTVPGIYPASIGWRAMVVPMPSSDANLFIALPLDTVQDTVSKSTVLVLSTGLLATLIMSMIAYGVTTRAFLPLVRVERTAAMIADGDLTQRVRDYPPETEVGRLSRSLNAMLAQIERAFKDREHSERKMRRFIQDASHELRTPLVTIQGYSEFYRHGGLADPEALDSAMGRIEAESKRMAQLVEDLLMLARLDEQRALEMAPVDLLVLGQDAVEDTRVRAPEREVKLVGLHSSVPAPASTRGDEARIRQVVANLLTNALRYTPQDSPLEIAVGVKSQVGDQIDAVIQIRDHGPGIPEEDAKKIFERFYRADSSRQRETGGSGLGLAIVAAIVAQHGGHVQVEDTPGGGATLAVHLPYIPVEEHYDDDDED